MKTKLLLFDFDGTLYNTVAGIHEAINVVAREKGAQEFPYDLIQKLVGYGLNELLKQLDDISHHQIGLIPEFAERFREVYAEIAVDRSEIFPGAVDFLKSWDGKLGIVSNKGEKILRHMVEQSELSELQWEAIIGGDTYPKKKPDPYPLYQAVELAGVSTDESLLVGDGIPDALACKAANISFIGVRFGYAPESELIRNGCEFFIDSYKDLAGQIQVVDASRK